MATDARFDVPEDLAVRVPAEAMAATAAGLFESVGMEPAAARRAADPLIYADLRGIDSHGVSNMFPFYLQWLGSGIRDLLLWLLLKLEGGNDEEAARVA